MHFQNLIGLLMRQKFPDVELRMASDGIVGLAMAGEFQPDVLIGRHSSAGHRRGHLDHQPAVDGRSSGTCRSSWSPR